MIAEHLTRKYYFSLSTKCHIYFNVFLAVIICEFYIAISEGTFLFGWYKRILLPVHLKQQEIIESWWAKHSCGFFFMDAHFYT